MGKFFVKSKESSGPEHWKKLLADPVKHWRTGYSAKALAYSWEEAGGFPPEVSETLDKCTFPTLQGIEFSYGLVEHHTPVPGRGRSSQTDLLVITNNRKSPTVIAVEGKVSEGFDKSVSEWNPTQSSNKMTRLSGLCNLLRLPANEVPHIKYQLLHRTASALIEAERFGISTAVMLVHSFSQTNRHLEDYQAFANLFGISDANVNTVSYAGNKNGIDLYLAWVRGDKRFLEK